MAARWQQWMPFHIDRFRGSPDVQAMHPSARCGFLYLLAAAWQTDDCSLSSDPLDLATASGLGDELWAAYGARILRKFEAVAGRLTNAVLLAEWLEAKSVYDKRRSGAVRTNESRSPSAERTQSERNADTVTETETGTETDTDTDTKSKKQKPLASTAIAVTAESRGRLLGTLPLTVGEYELREDDLARDRPLYPGVDVPQEYRAMKGWLLANPTKRKTARGVRAFMNNWLTKAQNTPKGRTNGTIGKQLNPSAGRETANFSEIDNALLNLATGEGADEERGGGVLNIDAHRKPSNHALDVAGQAGGQVRPSVVPRGHSRVSA